MRRAFAVITTAALALSLAGCGADSGTNGSTTGSGTARYGTASYYADRDASARSAADAAAARRRYALMLDNARVRDTDGLLFDGENPSHDTFF